MIRIWLPYWIYRKFGTPVEICGQTWYRLGNTIRRDVFKPR